MASQALISFPTHEVYGGDDDPSGFVNANPGDVYVRADGAASRFYQYQGATPGTVGWVEVGSGGGDFKADGTVAMTGDLDVGGQAVTNVGNVDGRDVSADGGKLDGIEAGADVTDAANVAAAGAVMDLDLVKVVTPADFAVNSTSLVTIVSHTVPGVAVGEQLIVDAIYSYTQATGVGRQLAHHLDFNSQFPLLLYLGGLTSGAAIRHVVRVRAVLDVRSTLAATAMVEIRAGVTSGRTAGQASSASTGGDSSTTGWNEVTAQDLTGAVTVTFQVSSSSAIAPQTLYLHSWSVRKLTPS